jgi:hypothetical protein
MATTLDWIAKLDIDVEPSQVRKSSIICTIGKFTIVKYLNLF